MTTNCVECVICEGEFDQRDCVRLDGYSICPDCAKDNDWKRCWGCGEWINRDEQYNSPNYDDSSVWCGQCLPEEIDYSAGSDDFFEDLVSDESDRCTSWEDWAKAADLADEVDFGCRFDENGKCQGSDRWDSAAACCCKDCAGNHGYLGALPVVALETVKRDYDGKTGFWRPGGCILPRKWRGYICQRYRCAEDDDDGELVWYTWCAFNDLFRYPPKDRLLTVNQVRLLMRELGLLKDEQLVTITPV